ncbi:Tyrosine-protein kinase [Quillaja saponaria]|uniref:non-specific serine/threonine protein kinase n=1 Tax=Quillaja saponaria TaxID=32244 RepID=A0AAD7KXP2_QUISA|nr:Tyrosine-protein kinase [Quillaja saponaria]
MQEAHTTKPENKRVAGMVGGGVATLIVIVVVVLVYICLRRVKRLVWQASENASSVPSPPVEWRIGNTSLYAGAPPPYDTETIRQLTISELEEATINFSQNNVIGEGRFGLVYKGLLQDGSVVAIKRNLNTPSQHFMREVEQIAHIHYTHLVKLIGYCEDSHQQLLVYDYLPNGNFGKHLYDTEGLPIGKLGHATKAIYCFGSSQRLGTPSHGNRDGPSSYTDPELNLSKNHSEKSTDVHSFGVFLLELISGRAAHGKNHSHSQDNLVLQVKYSSDLNKFVDRTLGEHTLHAARQIMELALQCLDIISNRPSMRRVVHELERIQEIEIGHLYSQISEEIGPVTLGSELFR